VVVGGSPVRPEIAASGIIEMLGGSERFCFHRAAEMEYERAVRWIERARKDALANARRALGPLLERKVGRCAIVAKDGDAGDLRRVLSSHPRIHTAEGCFYRDVLREACGVPTTVVAPASLDASRIG
jgi:hypothetical protein